MEIPFEPVLFGIHVNIHLVFEYAAFLIGFQYYVYLRRHSEDLISITNRLSIIIGAVFGAFIGSRVAGFLEQPFVPQNIYDMLTILNTKTIMGGLFGGLLGVELAKKIISETHSSGDLFTLPIILGIIIGRIGCFLSGIKDFTYGKETEFVLGMNLGDNITRHPLALYEIIFLVSLWMFLWKSQNRYTSSNGLLFKLFMLAYFGFRFCIEFLKPNTFFILGFSSIQYLCILCYLYYYKTIVRLFQTKKGIGPY